MTIKLNIDEIRKFVPHRFPFLLVDKVIAGEPGKTITGIKNVTVNEPFFTGHFPIKPVMPGVLMIEALAQTAGLLMAISLDWPENHDNVCYLAGVDKARFKRVIVPGDQLKLDVEIVKSRRDIWKFQGTASVEDQVACSAEVIIARG